MTQVQTRLRGEAWYGMASSPSSTFGFQFLSRFANVRLDEKVDTTEKKESKNIGFAALKKRRNRRGSVQKRRASITGTRRASITGTGENLDDKSSVHSARQSRRSSVALSVLNAFMKENTFGLAPVQRVRRNSVKEMFGKIAHPFKRRKNDLLNDDEFVFFGEKERTLGEKVDLYDEKQLNDLFDVLVMAKARRERDNIGFNMVELSGNRAFYTMHHAFLTEQSVYILVFNMEKLIDDKDVEAQKDEIRYLNYWLKVVKYHSPDADLLVVGTFAGNVEKSRYEKVESYISRLVFPELHKKHAERKKALKVNKAVQAANEFAKALEEEKQGETGFVDKKMNLIINAKDRRLFFPVELSTGKGVDNIRLAVDSAAQKQKYYSQKIPPRWLKFLDNLRSDSPNYFSTPERVKAVAFQTLENHEEEMRPALELFHELGYVVHITQIEQLQDTVITDTLSFYRNIFKLVFTDEMSAFSLEDAEKKGLHDDIRETIDTGKISQKLLDYLWTEEEPEEDFEQGKKGRQFLSEYVQLTLIMSQYKFNGQRGKYIIPSLIPENPKLIAETKEAYGDGRGLKCQFSFKGYLTLGVYERLVCLCLQYSGNQSKSLEPILAMGWCQLSFGMSYVFRLERLADDIVVQIIESKKKPSKLIVNIEKMFFRIKQFLGKGFMWRCLLQDENDVLVPFNEAKEKKLANWF